MDKDEPVWDLTAHDKEIYTIRWCPTTDDKLWLATASFDGMVVVNVQVGLGYGIYIRVIVFIHLFNTKKPSIQFHLRLITIT
jgi:hypothetical protein